MADQSLPPEAVSSSARRNLLCSSCVHLAPGASSGTRPAGAWIPMKPCGKNDASAPPCWRLAMPPHPAACALFSWCSWPFTLIVINIRGITIVFGSCQLAKVPAPVGLRGRRTRRVQQDGRRREREGGGARSAIQPGQFRRGPWRLCALPYLCSRCSAPLSGDSERRIATRSYASACSGL